MAQLPAGNRPPRHLAAADSAAAVLADMGPPGPQNPVSMGVAFLGALSRPGGPNLTQLGAIVTPESWSTWGDFREVAAALAGCGWMTRARPSRDDPRVAYVQYVTDHDRIAYRAGDTVRLVRAIATMVYRPSLGGWRLHAVGDFMQPDQVPHDR